MIINYYKPDYDQRSLKWNQLIACIRDLLCKFFIGNLLGIYFIIDYENCSIYKGSQIVKKEDI